MVILKRFCCGTTQILINSVYIILYFVLSSISSNATQQVEEGWRWKKTFSLQLREGLEQHPVDHVHAQMAIETGDLHSTLDKLVATLDVIVQPIRQILQKKPLLHRVFESLNAEDKSIGDILANEDPGGVLRLYWLENADQPQLPASNDQIIYIIRRSLERLSTRNLVLAEIGTIVEGKFINTPIVDSTTGLRAVFMSGTGNQLIEIIEEVWFSRYTFVTFDRSYGDGKFYVGFLKRNLGDVLSHNSHRIPEIMSKKSASYKGELDTFISAESEYNRKCKAYSKNVKAISFAKERFASIPLDLTSVKVSESFLRQSQATLKDIQGLAFQLEASLSEVQSSYVAAQRLIPEFFHSEQLLRLFLYNNLESLVRRYLPFDKMDQVLSLLAHSSNDVCERCTHCLFLESEMSNVVTEDCRPTIRKKTSEAKTTAEVKDPFGFFEKFSNSIRETLPELKYQILVSSSKVGEQRGVQHRYQSGHDVCADEPINLSQFPPLLAFKVIPSEFDLLPLPSTLTPPEVGRKAILLQSYFPDIKK